MAKFRDFLGSEVVILGFALHSQIKYLDGILRKYPNHEDARIWESEREECLDLQGEIADIYLKQDRSA